ncbi:MAG: aldo/keto reductase [Alphaproteobacteria bacterium]|nr:aldo/keto reductase [Alphaproteobacteria bacterium]
MRTRRLGPFEVSAIGFGCMNLSHGYGVPPDTDSGARMLHRVLECGYRLLDTATLYGRGANERLIGEALCQRRGEFILASKCGLSVVDGKRVLDVRPQSIKRSCEESLRRLKTEVIDLYYLHRYDRAVPIEDCVGALAELVTEGKIRAIGLSEVSAATLRRAHKVHRIAAVQSEYSLWTRNPEFGVLEACRELDIGFVAFSPLGRGFLAGAVPAATEFAPGDIRRFIPRFHPPYFDANRKLLVGLARLAQEAGCTMAQLSLAWLLAKAAHIVPIPGTAQLAHMQENARADEVRLDAAVMAQLEVLINPQTVQGPRYDTAQQADIDTEERPT